MKKKVYILTILLMGFGLMATSCSDFIDVNKDPNHPTDVAPDLILPTALDATAGYISAGTGSLNMLGSLMMFNYSQSYGWDWFPTSLKYQVTTGYYTGMFNDAYADADNNDNVGFLVQYTHLANLTKERYGYYKAIGMIMQAYHYQILVDLYGDIPYSQAEKRSEIPTPVYDDAQAVYDSLVVKLTNAIKVINQTKNLAAPVVPKADDGLYHGNMTKWARFANSIKIRILTRENGVKDAGYINAQLSNIQQNGYGYIQSNVKDNPGYIDAQPGKQNPYWSSFGIDGTGSITSNNKAVCATLFVVHWFQQTNDTLRFTRIFELPATGALGINQGGIDPTDDHSMQTYDHVASLKLHGGILIGGAQATVIMTEAELQLNLAELALKGFSVQGTAEDHYKHAVRSSFNYLGLTKSDANTYLSQNIMNVSWNSSPNKMNAILTQKWLATFGLTAAQSWFDYNRTGLPNAMPIQSIVKKNADTAPTGWPISFHAQSHTDRPVRLMYPVSEYNRNPENVPPADKFDPFTDKIFWAQ